MCVEQVAKEDGGGFMGTLTLVLALGLGGRGTRRRAFGAVDARSVRATLLAAPKLASTDLLHVRKRELLVIARVVQDLAIRIAKGEVGRGLEGGHKDGLQDIVDSEGVQVAQNLAGVKLSFTFPRWVLTARLESPSH